MIMIPPTILRTKEIEWAIIHPIKPISEWLIIAKNEIKCYPIINRSDTPKIIRIAIKFFCPQCKSISAESIA